MGLAATSSAGGPSILRVTALTKSFAGQRVLHDVSLELAGGEIVALLGQNGSGKSTLVKLLAGVHSPDGGQITVGSDASRAGALHFIHQDLGLIDTLSTVENLALSDDNGPALLQPYRRRREREKGVELLARFGLHLDVDRPVGGLTPAQRSIVAIARAMSGWGEEENILVLDEPTASLQGDEVKVLIEAVREVARHGAAVLFISHRLDEVIALAARAVVLRDGVKVHDVGVDGLDVSALAEMITGERGAAPKPAIGRAAAGNAAPSLSVRGLAGGGLRGLDVDVRPGEVVGVAGSLGSGRENLAGLIFGAHDRERGVVLVDGAPVAQRPRAALRAGMALIPSDRHARGGVMHHSVRENVVLPLLRPLARFGVHLRRGRERADAREWAQRVQLRPMEPERPLAQLSGGNQQKVVVARALRTTPRVLLVEEPTHGVDVGAAEAVRQLILTAAEHGAAVLVTSSDNADLIRMCGEIVVLRDGVPVAHLKGRDINDHRLTLESLGGDLSETDGDLEVAPREAEQELEHDVI